MRKTSSLHHSLLMRHRHTQTDASRQRTRTRSGGPKFKRPQGKVVKRQARRVCGELWRTSTSCHAWSGERTAAAGLTQCQIACRSRVCSSAGRSSCTAACRRAAVAPSASSCVFRAALAYSRAREICAGTARRRRVESAGPHREAAMANYGAVGERRRSVRTSARLRCLIGQRRCGDYF